MVYFLPGNLIYSLLNFIFFITYSISYFVFNVGFEVGGAISLFYLTNIFFKKYKIPEIYSYISVFIFAFNVSVMLDGTFESGTSEVLIILLLCYLILYKNRIYTLLLGFFSFFIFFPFPGGYPAGALILLFEFILISTLMMSKELLFNKNLKREGRLYVIKVFSLAMGAIAISTSYLLFIIFSSGSTLITQSVSLKPEYVFGFIYDWIAIIPNSLRLILNWGIFTPYAGPWVSSYLSNPLINVILYFLPFFSLVSIIFLKREDYYLYFLMVVSIFSATASNPPFGALFEYIVLYFGPARVFYNSDAYYPILVIFYSFLFPITLFNFSRIIKNFTSNHKSSSNSKRIISIFIDNTNKFFVVSVIALLLFSVYPMYTGIIDESGPVMPVESSVPNYYFNASTFLSSQGGYNPVMVFPGINGFSSYEESGHTWYQGVNLYPTLIKNPSISDVSSSSYTMGRGNAYSIISYVYGQTLSGISQPNLKNCLTNNSINYISQNTNLIKWYNNYPNDSLKFINSSKSNIELKFHINENYYTDSIGSHDLLGNFHNSQYLGRYNYLTLNMSSPIPTSTISIGFMNSTGGFFAWLPLDNFIPAITPTNFSNVPVYLGKIQNQLERQNVTTIAISYVPQQGLPSTFNLTISSLKFGISPVNYSKVLSRGLNILGVKYAYVDTGIENPYGKFNGLSYDSLLSNSSLFRKVFEEGTVHIYLNKGYNGLINTYKNLVNYSRESSLFGSLIFNLSSNHMPLYGLNVNKTISFNASKVLCYSMLSPVNFKLKVSHKGPYAIFFKEGYNNHWEIVNSNGTVIGKHFEADGFGNGWIINSNSSVIFIKYKGSNTFGYLVTLSVSVPFILLAIFTFFIVKKNKMKLRRIL